MKKIVIIMMCLVALVGCSADTEFEPMEQQPLGVWRLAVMPKIVHISDDYVNGEFVKKYTYIQYIAEPDESLTLTLYNGYVVMSNGISDCKMACSINGDEYKVSIIKDKPKMVWEKFCMDVTSKGNVDEHYFKMFNPNFDDLYFGGMTGKIKKANNALTLTVMCKSTNEMNGTVLHDEEFKFVKIK